MKMGNNQQLAMTKTANCVANKNANKDVRKKCILFPEKLKLHLLILDKAIKSGKSTFSSHLAENLTV